MKKSLPRPKSIVDFERVYIAALALGFLNAFLSGEAPDHGSQDALRAFLFVAFMVILSAIVIALALLLLWLIARRASVVARWLYVVLESAALAWGFYGIPDTLATVDVLPAALSIGELGLGMTTLWLILTPEANAWFARRPYGLTDIFR